MATANQGLPDDAHLRAAGQFVREHPAVAGTVLYFWVAAMGVIYSWTMFREFGINIFDFAEPNDFILAAFKEPFTMAIAIVTVAFILIYYAFALRRIARAPIERHKGSRAAMLVMIAVACIAYTLVPAFWIGRRDAYRLKTAKTSLHVVHAKGLRGASSDSVQAILATLVGTTSKFMIFYDYQAHEAFALPTTSVQRIDVASRPTEAASGSTTNPWVQVFADSALSVALDTSRIEPTSTGDYLLWFETKWAQPRTTVEGPFNRESINTLLRCRPVAFKTVSVTVSYNDGPPIAHMGGALSDVASKPWKTPVARSADDGSFGRACAIITQRSRPD